MLTPMIKCVAIQHIDRKKHILKLITCRIKRSLSEISLNDGKVNCEVYSASNQHEFKKILRTIPKIETID